MPAARWCQGGAGAGGDVGAGMSAELPLTLVSPASPYRGQRQFSYRTAVFFLLVLEVHGGPGASLPVECRKA